MKLLVLSDLHVEFAPFVADPKTVHAADVVFLAGDIHQGTKGLSWARQAFPHKPIVYVAGNHEFYGHHWDTLIDELRQEAKKYDIYFLENQTFTLAGIRFLGATLWTDFEFFGKEKRSNTMRLTEIMLNDFKVIKANPLVDDFDDSDTSHMPFSKSAFAGQALSPEHTVVRHRESLTWLDSQLLTGDASNTVVITHHYPNVNSTASKWAKNPLTAGFGSKLDLQMLSKCKLWIHGHTHDSCDYLVGEPANQVRVVCNPRGYPRSRTSNTLENPNFNPQFLIDI
jgi:Icc-related predicted phosphoesterase